MTRNLVWIALAFVVLIAMIGSLRRTESRILKPARQEFLIDNQRPAPGPNGLYPVLINRPDGPPRLRTELSGDAGRPVTIACSTCHSIRTPNPANAHTPDLDEFHQGLAVAHGDLSCLSCHNRDDYDTLKLASGEALRFPDVMSLCAQCHGPQYRDYLHGAHGGMTGYWDRTRGPRSRNNCIDCHDAHSPAFPSMIPTFKPIDRFLEHHGDSGAHSGGSDSDD